MIRQDEPQPIVREVGRAMLLAAFTAAATGLVNWGLDALKKRVHTEPPP